MYLFNRMVRLAPGQQVAGIEWALQVTEKVNQITGLNVGLWTPILSPGTGTLSWGAAVETMTDLEDADFKLNADPMFVDLALAGSKHTVGSVEDQTAQFVHNPESDPGATHVSVVIAQMANGHFGRGTEIGVEIAERATKASGNPTAFLIGTTGPFASCAWITAATSLKSLEDGEQALYGGTDFIAYLDKEAADCYVQSAASQSIWRRIV